MTKVVVVPAESFMLKLTEMTFQKQLEKNKRNLNLAEGKINSLRTPTSKSNVDTSEH